LVVVLALAFEAVAGVDASASRFGTQIGLSRTTEQTGCPSSSSGTRPSDAPYVNPDVFKMTPPPVALRTTPPPVAAQYPYAPSEVPTPPPYAGATPSPCSVQPPPSGGVAAAIYAAAQAFEGTSTCNVPGTDNGQNACMWAVNQVIYHATGQYVAGGTNYVPTAVAAFDAGGAVRIGQSSTVPGDIVVVTSANGADMHIGICMTYGCTDVLSNSSSRCNFSWHSNPSFSYPGSPYNGGSSAFYHLQ
jgi:hypothetical protein